MAAAASDVGADGRTADDDVAPGNGAAVNGLAVSGAGGGTEVSGRSIDGAGTIGVDGIDGIAAAPAGGGDDAIGAATVLNALASFRVTAVAPGAAGFEGARLVADRDAPGGVAAGTLAAAGSCSTFSNGGVETNRFTASHHPSGPPAMMPAPNAAIDSTLARERRADGGSAATRARSASTSRERRSISSSSGSVSQSSTGNDDTGSSGGRSGSAGLRGGSAAGCGIGGTRRADADA